MKYNFDEIIDRRSNPYSYSMKWSDSQVIAGMLGVEEINDESIAIFTADMDFKCAQPIVDAMIKVAEHGIYGYSAHFCEPAYNEAVINWFKRRMDWSFTAEDIIFSHGTVEALKQCVLAFSQPNEGVIIQRPVYGPFSMVIESSNRTLVNNQLIEEEEGYYTIDFKDLEEKAKDPNNKLLLICNPHNPVGRIWRVEEMQEMARICRENDVIMVADEIHGDLIRKEETFVPMAKVVDDVNLITCTAVNKTFNLAGLSCTNLIITNKALREKYIATAGFTIPSPFGIAAVIAAYNEGEEWLDQVKDYIDSNIDFVIDFLKEKMPKVKCRRPEGTYILWMDFREYGLTPQEIHDRIYKNANVLLEGGSMFDPDLGGGYERVCLPSPRAVLEKAFIRIHEQFADLS